MVTYATYVHLTPSYIFVEIIRKLTSFLFSSELISPSALHWILFFFDCQQVVISQALLLLPNDSETGGRGGAQRYRACKINQGNVVYCVLKMWLLSNATYLLALGNLTGSIIVDFYDNNLSCVYLKLDCFHEWLSWLAVGKLWCDSRHLGQMIWLGGQ